MPLHHNGVNIPVFSLKSETSGGIGEYLDLIPLIDWAAEVGLDTLQILPINDPGLDTSPYNLQSAFALNPLLIKWPSLKANYLNALPYVDYSAVRELKEKALKNAVRPLAEISEFVKSHPWVEEYAKTKEGDKSLFEQYLCYTQMKQVKAHAEKKGIRLLGDIPILIAPDSVDATLHPQLFLKDLSAGAPPDIYSTEGQNWGFPLYNWPLMEAENYRWWKERLSYANEFYHLYRIDHIVGFYRIWAFPTQGKIHTGRFIPKEEAEWIHQGEKILKMMLAATSMKPIGEDLGVVPDEVKASLTHLGIPGTKVMRWEREWKEPGTPPIPYANYPQMSLTTVSTHDSTPLRLWDPQLKKAEIVELLRQSHATPSAFHINLLLEYFSALPDLSYENPERDRINTPGIISDKNWTWRMKPTLQEMARHLPLRQLMRYCLN